LFAARTTTTAQSDVVPAVSTETIKQETENSAVTFTSVSSTASAAAAVLGTITAVAQMPHAVFTIPVSTGTSRELMAISAATVSNCAISDAAIVAVSRAVAVGADTDSINVFYSYCM